MADFYVPYVINGSKHSARLFRRTFQQQVGEGSGVDRPGDLKVQALNIPGDGFRVAPGGGVAQSRDTSASSRESYGPVLDRELVVSGVPGTGSQSPRRDLVILEITDPEMESNIYPEPTSPEGWQDGDNFARITVIPDVDSLVSPEARPVKRLEQITNGDWKNVTGVTLAAINWPASTGTVSEAMLEDLRIVQSPFRSELAFARPRVREDDGPQNNLTERDKSGGEYFPGGAGYANQVEMDIPERATRMIIEADWLSVILLGGKNAWGNYWVEFGDEHRPKTWPGNRNYEFATQKFAFDTVGPVSGTYRANWRLMDNRAVPAKLRGKKATFVFKAGLADAADKNAIAMNSLSGLGLKVTFVESALTWEDAI